MVLQGDEKKIYSLLDLYPKTLDEIVSSCDLGVSETLRIILDLRLKGLVSECAKNNYIRKHL